MLLWYHWSRVNSLLSIALPHHGVHFIEIAVPAKGPRNTLLCIKSRKKACEACDGCGVMAFVYGDDTSSQKGIDFGIPFHTICDV